MSNKIPQAEAELLRRLDVLAKFGELALKTDKLDDILHEACRLVGEAFGTDLAKVMEVQDDGVTLLVRAGVGWPDGIVGKMTVKAERGSSEGFALSTGEPAISTDIDAETRFTYSDFIRAAGVKAMVNVIIIGPEDERPYGILQVDSRSPRQFSDRDTKFLRGYANLLAASVDRLRGAERLRRTNETLEERVVQRTNALKLEQTERAAAEEKLRQSQKMEAVGQLTGGLAHDFNNLLTGIIGSLAFIQKRAAEGRFGDIERYVAAAQGAGTRAAALTHRLLAFSRRQTLDPKPTNIADLVNDMEDLIRRTVGPSVAIEVVGAEGFWIAMVDRNQLENALLNLCINARDAMPDGGRLTITTTNERMSEKVARERDLPLGDYLSLCVSDTGTGMTSEVIERAFDPFFTTKPTGMGTGLGLSMTYGFARQSEGQARIYSELGRGTTVCLYLPRHHGAGANASAPKASVPLPADQAKQAETVLVVDDEEVVRMLVVEVLEELGYTAVEAGDGATALKTLRSTRRIDLLITDVGLPGGMNGRQLADEARTLRSGLKILFITGYAESAVFGRAPFEPDMQVLVKPFATNVLADRICTMIALPPRLHADAGL